MVIEPVNNGLPWLSQLDRLDLPVLQRTVDELACLRDHEDSVTTRDIARVVMHDAMFAVRVLRHLHAHHHTARQADITTVEHALLMLGISAFFRHFSNLPVIELTMADRPDALNGLARVLSRAHHAALHARDWADLRQDARADEVAIAALLHDLAEMLLWCFAPEAALQINAMQCAQEPLRDQAAQTTVLGFRLSDFQTRLIAEWSLAPVLRTLLDESQASHPRELTVSLAVRLARHSSRSWENPALPEDYAAIGKLLKLPQVEALARVRRVAVKAQAASDWYHLGAASIPVNLQNPADSVVVFP